MEILEHTFTSLCGVLKRRYGRGSGDAQAILRQVHRAGNTRFRDAPQFRRYADVALRFEKELSLTLPEEVDRRCEGETTKLLFRLGDGNQIESVLVPMARYTTICVSSQVGCRMGCAFCQTAKMGFVRQLNTGEMVAQIFWAKHVARVPIRNVVFMGMGEPLDNFANLAKTLAVITDQRGLDIAPRHITVSTVGLASGIRQLAALGLPLLNLAVSLNAPNDTLRNHLMPVNRHTPLAHLQALLKSYPLHHRNAHLISYVLIPGVNDLRRHADELAHFVAPLRAKVNLIPFNPSPQTPYRAPETEELERFRKRLVTKGVFVRRRTPKGQAILAACGQLGARIPLKPPQAPP